MYAPASTSHMVLKQGRQGWDMGEGLRLGETEGCVGGMGKEISANLGHQKVCKVHFEMWTERVHT
jgi:hypothetical protein